MPNRVAPTSSFTNFHVTFVRDLLSFWELDIVKTSALYRILANMVLKIKLIFLSVLLRLDIGRVVDIAHDFGMLADILLEKTDSFALDAACYAARHDFIDLEKWLENAITADGSTFVRAALDFVGHKVRHDLSRQDQAVQQGSEPSTLSITAPIIATFLRALRSQ